VLIGPNGTGKSSIINGIGLACGSDAKTLGRSSVFGEYIKHGKQSGFVELHV